MARKTGELIHLSELVKPLREKVEAKRPKDAESQRPLTSDGKPSHRFSEVDEPKPVPPVKSSETPEA